jgi:hypothetical protein
VRPIAARGWGGRRAAPPCFAVALLFWLTVPYPLGTARAQPPPPEQSVPGEPVVATEPDTGRIVRLSGRNHVWRWSFVDRRTIARESPGSGAPKLVTLSTRTPERTANLVLVLSRTQVAGRQWVRVRLPMLPNDTTGWVPRSALGGYETVRTRLFIDRRRQRLRLTWAGRTVFRARVGIGTSRHPTPRGHFYVRNHLRGFRSPAYGPVAFGTSARSPVLTDWPGGGFVGIHGTNEPNLIPGRISHGCIRLRNREILRLARLMPIGTPITIS